METTLQVQVDVCDCVQPVSSFKTVSVVQGEDDEAKRNVSMSQERQRTLEKLRSLRQVGPPLQVPALIFDVLLCLTCSR